VRRRGDRSRSSRRSNGLGSRSGPSATTRRAATRTSSSAAPFSTPARRPFTTGGYREPVTPSRSITAAQWRRSATPRMLPVASSACAGDREVGSTVCGVRLPRRRRHAPPIAQAHAVAGQGLRASVPQGRLGSRATPAVSLRSRVTVSHRTAVARPVGVDQVWS
jgi:hypothetical protein